MDLAIGNSCSDREARDGSHVAMKLPDWIKQDSLIEWKHVNGDSIKVQICKYCGGLFAETNWEVDD